jgi:hypothetical protein
MATLKFSLRPLPPFRLDLTAWAPPRAGQGSTCIAKSSGRLNAAKVRRPAARLRARLH